MRTVYLVLCLGVSLAAAGDPLSIKVSSAVLMENQALRITCKVPLNSENRKLTIGLDGMRSSEFPIDGASGPVTNNLFLAHVICGSGPAFCTLETSDGRKRTLKAPVRVIGGQCEPLDDDAGGVGLPSQN